MQGLELLNKLPETTQKAIISKYGSLKNYYQHVYKLYQADRYWFSNKTDVAKTKRQEIQNQLFDLEDELETFGLTDGHAVLTEISSDHGEEVLDDFLKKLGFK